MSDDLRSIDERLSASARTPDFLVARQTLTERVSEQMRAYAELTGHSVKIAGLVSLVVGTTLLVSYLIREGAPFPSLEGAAGAYLAILVISFVKQRRLLR